MLILRELRKKAGLTMKELGTEIGVAESTISQYETGKRQPDFETLLKLGEFFGVTVDTLLRGKEDTKKAPGLNAKDERDIARQLEKLQKQIEDENSLMFDGNPMSDEARESILAAMKLGLEAAKMKNKATYTPKKYKKE